jgi:hypothetical protein
VTPLTLLLQRAASTSKPSSPRGQKQGQGSGTGSGKGMRTGTGRGGGGRGHGRDRDRDREGLYSPGSKGTTLDSVTPFLDRTQLALLCSDTDDRTTLYGTHNHYRHINTNTNADRKKSSPVGSSNSQLDSGSVCVHDQQRERERKRGGDGEGRVGDGWVDESHMTWCNTAMHLLKSGEC